MSVHAQQNPALPLLTHSSTTSFPMSRRCPFVQTHWNSTLRDAIITHLCRCYNVSKCVVFFISPLMLLCNIFCGNILPHGHLASHLPMPPLGRCDLLHVLAMPVQICILLNNLPAVLVHGCSLQFRASTMSCQTPYESTRLCLQLP